MTDQQILEATGDDLSRMAGEVLQPETLKHVEAGTWKREHKALCGKCDKWYAVDLPYGHAKGPCLIPDPIPLDWPNAMKWRDWAVAEYGKFMFENQFLDVLLECGISTLYIGSLAQPAHYLQAAMLCKIRSKP